MRPLPAIVCLLLSAVLLAAWPESGAAQGAAAECVQERNGESSMHRHCWDSGKRQGRWIVRLPGGEVREGSYVAGKKQGHWVIRFPDGGVQEGPYVAGEKQGRWVLRYADGTVEEGPVVAGLREGRWAALRPDGSRRTFEMDGGALVPGSVRVLARQAQGGREAPASTREEPRPVRSAEESSVRLFAAHALALRAAGLAGEEAAMEVLAAMPGADLAGGGESLPVLWRPFFANAVVKLGRAPSPAPVTLYYNPLLDVAVFTLWEKWEGGYRVVSARALPGERLGVPAATAEPLPSWTAAAGPVDALARATAARLGVFRSAHPVNAATAGREAATFAAAAADMRAALPRLVWNAAQRTRWTEEAQPWLRPALAEVERALAARRPAALVAAAPATDAETAAALARLPAGFAAGLALDMVLEAEGGGRFLIGSLPEDGDVYVLVLCRLEGSVCALRRFMLAALLE